MDIEHLKGVWREQEPGSEPDAGRDVARVADRVATLRRRLRRRDYREHAAAIACVLIFARLAFVVPSPVARAAAVFLVAASLLGIVMLLRANPGRRETDRAATVRAFCENELRRVDAQIRLLLSVTWWSVAPILVGVNVMFAALSPRLLWTLLYLLATLALGAFISYLNRQAVSRYLVPLRNDLVRLLGEES